MKNYTFLIGLILSIAVLWPLVAAPFFSHQDNIQTIRLYEMHQCFLDHQLPCRWVPDLGDLYGYPLFNYYAPLPYYVGEIFYLLTGSFIVSVKLMFATAFLGAYLGMYLLGRRVWGDWGGLVSGVFYSYAPYHALDFYVRGAMGEMWGLMWFPFCVWSLLRLTDTPRLKNVALFGLCFGMLLLSHNLSVMMITPVLVVLALANLQKANFTIKLWMYLFSAVVLALLLAAFYWLPAYGEKSLVHLETTIEGYFSYTEHFKGLRRTIFDRSWQYGGSFREIPGGPVDGMSYQVGWIHLLGLLLATVLAWIKFPQRSKERRLVIVSFMVVVISIFMIHPRSEMIWKLIDPLKYLQFPWRFLALSIFGISLLVGSLGQTLTGRKKGFLISLLVVVVLFNFNFFRPEKFLDVTDQQMFSGKSWTDLLGHSIFDYLPIYAEAPPATLATQPYQVLAGHLDVSNYHQGTDWIYFNVDAHEHSILRLSQYYFPNWRIFVDGKQVPIEYKNPLGLMTIIVGVGQHDVYAKLADSTLRTVGNMMSLVGFTMLIIIGLIQLKSLRRPVIYMLKSFYK